MNSVHAYLDDAEPGADDVGFLIPKPLAAEHWRSPTTNFPFPWEIRFFQHDGEWGAALWGGRLFSWAWRALVEELS